MKNRVLAIVILALAVTAVLFIAKRSEVTRTDSSQHAAKETVSEDKSPHPLPAESAGQVAAVHAGSSVVSATTKPPVASQSPGNPGEQHTLPYPANQPVVVGSRVFVPKAQPPPPDAQGGVELDKVRLMLRDYRTLYHENPVGTNAEIMKAVMGGNPKQAQLGPPEGQTLNANGELVDRWGTPYFFHQLSSELMEIRSAGSDKTLWTSDDIVTK